MICGLCTYCGILGLEETGFISDTLELMKVVLPASGLFALWRIFVTNRIGPRGGVVVLGLDDSSKIYSCLESPIAATRACLYLFTGVLTFCLGLLVSDLYRILFDSW
jgi:hypothetical protein